MKTTTTTKNNNKIKSNKRSPSRLPTGKNLTHLLGFFAELR